MGLNQSLNYNHYFYLICHTRNKYSLISVYFILLCSFYKSDAQTIQWVRKLESNASVKISDMKFGQNSSVYVLMNFSGSVDVDPGISVLTVSSAGQTDFCLLHILANGTLNWSKSFGGSGVDFASALEFDDSGNIVIAGSFSSTFDFLPGPGFIGVTAFGQCDAFIAQYDVNGNYLSHRVFGGFYNDELLDLDRTASGNFIVTGTYQGTIDFDPGSGQNYVGSFNGLIDMYVSSFDASLNFQWVKNFGGTGITKSVKIVHDSNNNIFVCGYFSGLVDFDPTSNPLFLPAGGISSFVISLSPQGALRRLGFLQSQFQCFPIDMDAGQNGTLTICGRFNGVTDLNPDTSLQLNINGSSQGDDAFMLILDTNLNLVWHKTIVSSFADAATGTSFMPDGNIIFSGYFKGIYDFLDGPNFSLAGDNNESRGFILQLSPSGSLLGVKDYGIDGTFPGRMAISPLGLFVLSGNFSGNVNMNPDTGQYVISGINTDQIFLARYMFCANLGLPDSLIGDTLLCSGAEAEYRIFGVTNPVWFFPADWSPTGLPDTIQSFQTGQESGLISVASSDACGIGPALSLPVNVIPVDINVQNTAGAIWSTNYNATSYQWLDCNSGYQPIAGALYQSFWPSAPGSYALQIQQGFCTDTSDCENILITALSQNSSDHVFFPNPTLSYSMIKLSEPVLCVHVVNTSGLRHEINFTYSGEEYILDFSRFQAGLFCVEIKFHSGRVLRQTIIHH